MSGHGAARNLPANKYTPCNCSDDDRRVITVRISSSWDIDASGNSTPGHTNDNVWNGVNCAIAAWNNAQDQSGNKTGYYFILDQAREISMGDADITIQKHTIESGGGFAQTDPIGSLPNINMFIMKLAGKNKDLNNNQFRPEDLCGRVAHEIGHIVSLNDDTSCMTIMRGTNPTTGIRPINSISASDVEQANKNIRDDQRPNCNGCWASACESGGGGSGDEGGGSEPTCEYRSHLAFENCDIFESPQCCDKYLITEQWCNGVLVYTNREYGGNTCEPEL